MPSQASASPRLRIYLFLNAAAFFAAGALMIALERTGSLSALRLILIGATFLLGAALLAAAVLLHFRGEVDQSLQRAIFDAPLRTRLVPTFGIAFPIFWSLTWLPPSYSGDLYYYFIGFYPLFLCGTLACGSALIFLLSSRVESTSPAFGAYWRAHRTALIVALAALGSFALLALLTSALHILAGREPYWYSAGVPILASQVFLGALITAIFLHIEARPPRIRLPVDLLLFLSIWVIAGALWVATPVRESYWVTGPRPPNFEAYPFSDLATFDVASQFALIGQGINNHVFLDRGLYPAFLVYLHSLGGQDYQQLMSFQAALFAIFPALLYLVGKRLHSRPAGILIAALITMRGLNSLTAAAWIDTSTFKHMLTDFPTAICLAIVLLLLLRWLDAPDKNRSTLLWIGGLLGIGSLLRPHVLVLLPFVLLLAAWQYRKQWRSGLGLLALTVVTALAAVSPWTFLSPGAGSFYSLYGKRIVDVMAQRYPALAPAPTAAATAPPATSSPVVLPTVSAVPSAPEAPTPAPALPAGPVAPAPSAGLPFQVTQYLHNLVTAGLSFPDSPLFFSVKDTVKSSESLWEPRWDGSLSPVATIMLVLSLIAVALGLGTEYQRLRWRGFVPLGVLLIYFAANALARTSGGRYLVPVDWIVICYFGVGLVEVLQLGGRLVAAGTSEEAAVTKAPAEAKGLTIGTATAPLIAFILIGGLIPLAGVLYPVRYEPAQASTTLAQAQPRLSNLGLSVDDVNGFLAQPGAVALYGRALYPRFYAQGTGEPVRYYPYREMAYPRTVFILIGPAGQVYTILAGPPPKVLPDASDVLVLGCRGLVEGYDVLDALAVLEPVTGAAYLRSPEGPLTCPLRTPVCSLGGACH